MPSEFHAPEKVDFLAGDEKKAWAKRKQRFIVTAVRGPIVNTFQGKTSERHIYTLLPVEKDGTFGVVVQLPMTDNDVRLQVADAMVSSLAEDATGVGPCVLAWVNANVPGGGVWSIEPA